MLLVGYFEGIDSQRGIAWRCADSLSLRAFLGYGPTETTPDHSTLTKIRQRLPAEVFDRSLPVRAGSLARRKLLSGKTVGVDSTTLEANAAMKSIVRSDTGEDWKAVRHAADAGGGRRSKRTKSRPTRRSGGSTASARTRRSRTTSGRIATDPDGQIAKMKDGRTHLAYKAEHVVDLKTEAILAAEIYAADQADTATLVPSVEQAQENVDATESGRAIEEVAADKGYQPRPNARRLPGVGTCWA